jgi:hypothetical protein
MVKATAQKVLSLLPGGRIGNVFLQRHVTRSLVLDSYHFERIVLQCLKHLENYMAMGGHPEGTFTVLELGTGWYPIIPIAMYLCGASEITTLDIQPYLTPESIRAVVRMYLQEAERGRLFKLLPWVDRARVNSLCRVVRDPGLRSVHALLHPLGIKVTVGDARSAALDLKKFDFFLSNGVLGHIHESALLEILTRFRRLAAPRAVMSHYIYMGDPFFGFDTRITPYNFLRFSKPLWTLIDNSLKPYNRSRISDYRRVHAATGWTVKKEETDFGSPEDLRQISVAKEFQGYSEQDLLAVRTWLVSGPA